MHESMPQYHACVVGAQGQQERRGRRARTRSMLCSMAEYRASTRSGARMRSLLPAGVVAVMTAVAVPPAFMMALATCDL
jgi:hypothetical protein